MIDNWHINYVFRQLSIISKYHSSFQVLVDIKRWTLWEACIHYFYPPLEFTAVSSLPGNYCLIYKVTRHGESWHGCSEFYCVDIQLKVPSFHSCLLFQFIIFPNFSDIVCSYKICNHWFIIFTSSTVELACWLFSICS